MFLAIFSFILLITVNAENCDTGNINNANNPGNTNIINNPENINNANNPGNLNNNPGNLNNNPGNLNNNPGNINNTNVGNSSVTYYDTFTGKFITLERYRQHVRANNSFWCTGEFRKCDPNEGRRIDGTCNNLKYPTRGGIHTPPYRLLLPEYDRAPEFDPRRSKDGNPLPLERPTRVALVQNGFVPDLRFTQLLSYGLVAFAGDVIAIFDTVNYVIWKTYCCTPRGLTDRECTPNQIPADDPVHQFSGIRCQNMTRPRSFQSSGCVKNDTAPIRIVSSSPSMDLSNVYGNTLASLNTRGRQFEGGLLKTEVENGKIWPPSTKTPVNVCLLNQPPRETRCHNAPEDGGNGILASNLFLIWVWRHHNFIATSLREINPCWDDERLFQTAKEINLAYMMQIYFYELMPDLMGYENLINNQVLSRSFGFRDIYDENSYPQISVEYPFALRWAHLFQDTKVKMYDAEGYYLKEVKMVNLTLRTGYLVDNLEFITQGAFRQPGGNINDYVIDPDLGERALGPHQRSLDVTTNDLAKNRYFGFAPYVKYKELCTGKRSKSFSDLLDLIDLTRVEQLADVYKHVEDIDLMAGMWVERRTYGSVPPTFFCIIADTLLKAVKSDRHWYERPNRPNAFNLPQLLEIRKASMARLLCDVGDTVTEIQPKAFLRAAPGNRIRSCDFIPKMDFTPWLDYTCNFQK